MENDPAKLPKQVCTITVIFQAASDDDAIAVKKKIAEAVGNLPEARTDFRITNLSPPRV